ncbi:hypothetical protein SBA2_270038 [Acidobacteriia bacterium SbA2]|nr:hypothetical protein SBA2_270038 [Acidobacteriia bacterium SbA2]
MVSAGLKSLCDNLIQEVIPNPSLVILSPSLVILSGAKNLALHSG